MVLPGDERSIEQLTKQLYKLVNVLNVQDITCEPKVERGLMLLKVNKTDSTRSEILEIADVFRAKVVDFGSNSITLEVTGDDAKMEALELRLSKFGIFEIARTGILALVRTFLVSLEFLGDKN